MQLEVGLLAQGRDYGDAQTPHQTENDETEKEESRARVEFRIETAGEKRQNELTGKLGTALTVTRERKYRHEFDDGLLYKGKLCVRGGSDAAFGLQWWGPGVVVARETDSCFNAKYW